MSVLILTACGGGGDDGQGPPVDPFVPGNVSITPPDQDTWGQRASFTKTSSGTYETELSSTIFNGGVSFVESADCNGHPGFHVTLSNAATNETVNASERVTCELIVFRVGRWQSGRMALELGSNRITASGADNTATITVVRVARPPKVAPLFPADGSIDVPLPISELRVTFSEDMSGSSINSASFILEDSSGVPVPGNVRSFSLNIGNFPPDAAGFTPSEPLRFATTYTARITTDVTDVHGISLANEFSWSFTTVADVLPPSKLAESPAAGNSCSAPDRGVSVRFDKLLDPTTLTSATFALEDGSGTPVIGDVSLNEYIATFTPAASLDSGASYTAYLHSGITDTAGNPLAPSSWAFSTAYAAEGTWTPISVPADMTFISDYSTVWTGAEMIVWGGYDGDGIANENRRYDPALNLWGFVSAFGAPSRRNGHTATWTGSEMIVWGGRTNLWEFFNDGGRYDPVADSWTPMSTSGAPSARNGHTEVWTGTELIVWGGGLQQTDFTSTGGRYDPLTDTWAPISIINAPTARRDHHAVFDGQYMIVWGGEVNDGGSGVIVSDGAVYDPVTDVWTPLPIQNAPDITKSTSIPDSVVLAGNDMLVWSPWSESVHDPFTDSSSRLTISETRRYDGDREQWLSVVDACESLATPNAVWLDGRMISWNEDFSEGYAYDEQRDVWHPITSVPGEPLSNGTVIAVGDSVILWDAWSFSDVGYRLDL